MDSIFDKIHITPRQVYNLQSTAFPPIFLFFFLYNCVRAADTPTLNKRLLHTKSNDRYTDVGVATQLERHPTFKALAVMLKFCLLMYADKSQTFKEKQRRIFTHCSCFLHAK